MSAATAQCPTQSGAIRRRMARHPIAVPVDITVLRSGIPDSIPGRTVNVGEGGVAAILAGELRPGDSVGVEFGLPSLGVRLHTKAVVRHQQQLRCGLEFQGLSLEEQGVIRYWALRAAEEIKTQLPVAGPQLPVEPQSPVADSPLPVEPEPANIMPQAKTRRGGLLYRALWMTLAMFVVVAGVGWWQWYRAWDELESRLPGKQAVSEKAVSKISAEDLQPLVMHKVDPVYPEAARQAKLEGVVVLDTVIGRDGSVVKMHAVSGPDVLAYAAMDAVRWWRFQPYRVNGQAVPVETRLEVEFRL